MTSSATAGTDADGVVLEKREPLLRAVPNEGRLKRPFRDVDSAAGASVVVVCGFPWNLKRFALRPAFKAPRAFETGASVVVVVVVVVGSSVVVFEVVRRVVVVVGTAIVVISSASVVNSSLSVVVTSMSFEMDFLSSSLAFSLTMCAYKSNATFSISGVVSSSTLCSEFSVVLVAYLMEDLDTLSKCSDLEISDSTSLGPCCEFLSFSSVKKM